MKRQNIIFRFMTWFTALAVLLSEPVCVHGAVLPIAQGGASGQVTSLSASQELLASLKEIPQELGSLTDLFWVDQARGGNALSIRPHHQDTEPLLVVHIQDAHSIPEAQSRIKEILQWVKGLYEKNFPGQKLIIGVEGSAGPLHPEYLRLWEEYPEANEAFVQDLFQKGELSGAAAFAWDVYKAGQSHGASPVVITGIESPELYRENLSRFRGLLFKQQEIESLLKPYHAQLAIAQSRFLNPQLRDFLKDTERLEGIPSTVLRHIRETLKIDLGDRVEQLRFPNLTRYFYLREIEPLLDKELAAHEWKAWQSDLLRSGGTYESFIRLIDTLFTQNPSSAIPLRKLLAAVEPLPDGWGSLVKTYPHLSQWISYQLLGQELESRSFMAELGHIRNAIMDRLATSEQEKRVMAVYQDYQMLFKLLHAELTREDHESVLSRKMMLRPAAVAGRLNKLLEKEEDLKDFRRQESENRAQLNQYFKDALNFYQGALERDKSLLENALSTYYKHAEPGEPAKDASQSGILVLISGGFHSDGLGELLKRQGVSHLVITPRISGIEKESTYHKVMRRQNAGLSSYFEEDLLNKQEALFLKGLLEVAPIELNRIYGVEASSIPEKVSAVLKTHPVLKNRLEGIVLGDQENPFLRVNIRQQQGSEPAEAGRRAVAEVELLTSARNYGYLAAQDKPPSVSGPQRFTASFKRLGHAVIRPEPVSSSSLPQALKVSSGDIDAATATRWGSFMQQVSGLGTTGQVSRRTPPRRAGAEQLLGGSSLLLPARSELRAADEIEEVLEKYQAGAEVLGDPEQLKKAIAEINVRQGGVRDLLSQAGEAALPAPNEIPARANAEQRTRYLRQRAQGKLAFGTFAGGRYTRMNLPPEFDVLGIAGLTPKILRSLPEREGAAREDFQEALQMIEDVKNGVLRELDDLNIIQRHLLQLRYQTEELVRQTPEAGLTAEEILQGDVYVAIVSEENMATIGKSLAAIRFAGLNPSRIIFYRQPKEGGREVLPDGTTRPYDAEKWPEGHGAAMAGLWHDARNTFVLDRDGNAVPAKQPVMAFLKTRNVEDLLTGKINDMPYFSDMALVERWAAGTAILEEKNAAMVFEVVNKALDQNAGIAIPNAAGGIHQRDTLALNAPDLENLLQSKESGRMLYLMRLSRMPEKLQLQDLPLYLRVRRSREGKTVLTREFVSGDISSAVPTYLMKSPSEKLDTIKARSRAQEAVAAMSAQNNQPGFGELASRLAGAPLPGGDQVQVRRRFFSIFQNDTFYRDLRRKLNYRMSRGKVEAVSARKISNPAIPNQQEFSFFIKPNEEVKPRLQPVLERIGQAVPDSVKIYTPSFDSLRVNLGGRFSEVTGIDPLDDEFKQIAMNRIARDIQTAGIEDFELAVIGARLRNDGSIVFTIEDNQELSRLRFIIHTALVETALLLAEKRKKQPLSEEEKILVRGQFRVPQEDGSPSPAGVITAGRVIPLEDRKQRGVYLNDSDLVKIERIIDEVNVSLSEAPAFIRVDSFFMAEPEKEFLESLPPEAAQAVALKESVAVDPASEAVQGILDRLVQAIRTGEIRDFKEKDFDVIDPVQRRGILAALKTRLREFDESWKNGTLNGDVPQWQRLWWRARIHAIVWLIDFTYLHLSEQAAQAQTDATRLLASSRAAFFTEQGVLRPRSVDKDGNIHIETDLYALQEAVQQDFGSGISIRTFMATPPNSGYEGSAILAAALMKALLTLRKHPDQEGVRVETPLRWQLSSAGGSDNFDWGMREGMTMLGGAFHVDGSAPVVVEVERLPAGEFRFESIDLRKTDEEFDIPDKKDPLRHLKMALVLSVSLSEEQPFEDAQLAAYLGAVLEGLPQIAVYGGLNSANALAEGGVKLIENTPANYLPKLRTLGKPELLSDFSEYFRHFKPGLRKGAIGRVSTSGRQGSRALLLLTNQTGIYGMMGLLRTDTFNLVETAEKIFDLLGDEKKDEDKIRKNVEKLATFVNNIQLWTNRALQESTPEPLHGFLEKVRQRYEAKTKSKLGILVQGAGPIGGVVMVAAYPETLDDVVRELLPEYTGELKQPREDGRALFDPENIPGFFPLEMTDQGIQTSFFRRAELRSYEVALSAQLRTIRSATYETARMKEEVRLFASDRRTLQELEGEFPYLKIERKFFNSVAASFYDPDLFHKVDFLPAWRFFQLMLMPESVAAAELPEAVAVVRGALGDLITRLDSPVTIVQPLRPDAANDELLRIAGALAAAYPHVHFSFAVQGSPSESREYAKRLLEQLHRLKLPGYEMSDILGRFEFVPASTDAPSLAKATIQIWSQDRKMAYGVVDRDRPYLENIGYVPGMARINHAKLDRNTAVMITAALLREIISDHYEVVNLDLWVQDKNLNIEQLVENVALMIQALNHLATQA